MQALLDANDYAAAYRLMEAWTSDSTDPDVQLVHTWLLGAADINGGVGPFAGLVKAYNQRQGLLRGRVVTDAENQDASDVIARLVIRRTIDNGAIPAFSDIVDFDADGGRALYAGLTDGQDTAKLYGANWTGTFLISPFGNDQTDRLLKSGVSETAMDSMDDLKNVLFAYDAFQSAIWGTFQSKLSWGSAWNSVLAGYGLPEEERLFGLLNVGPDWTDSIIAGFMRGRYAADALSFVRSLDKYDVLDNVMRAWNGRFIAGTNEANFVQNASAFFASIDGATQRSMALERLDGKTAEDLAALALADIKYRNALMGLSAFALDLSPAQYAQRGLELDMSRDGSSGELTEQWIKDRVLFLSSLVKAEQTDAEGISLLSPSFAAYFEDKESKFALDLQNSFSAGPRYIFGGTAADSISGGGTDDHLYGGKGSDTLQGAGGHDYLEGGSDNDRLDRGASNDTLIGGAGGDTLTGGGGNDSLEGGIGADVYVIDGSAGTDVIVDKDGGSIEFKGHALTGGKAISSGAEQWEEDYAIYTVANVGTTRNLVITIGPNTVTILDWEEGKFGINLQDAVAPVPVQSQLVIHGDLEPLDGDEQRRDEFGNIIVDPSRASPDRQDTLYDSTGNDELYGHGGDDQLKAFRGGSDLLDGGGGDDLLLGGAGEDTLIGGEGSDRLHGQEDDDQLFADRQLTRDEVWAANAVDNGIAARGDMLSGYTGDDFIVGAEREDFLVGGTGRDAIFGGAGDDVLLGDSEIISVSPGWRVVRTTDDNVYKVTTYELNKDVLGETDKDGDFLYGGAGSDWLFGQNGNDYLDGATGNDVLFGGKEGDFLQGGEGNDLLHGDIDDLPTEIAGDDYLVGGAGNDSLWGDGQHDRLYGGDGDDLLQGDNGEFDAALHGDDFLDGGIGQDTLYGEGGADTLLGGDGNDHVVGDDAEEDLPGASHGHDTLLGGIGNDTLLGTGGDDLVRGEDDNDLLYGDADIMDLAGQNHGSDTLEGGLGNDTLKGGGADDTLSGSEGNDYLVGDDETLPDDFHGDDRLDGGADEDTLLGGAGNDTLKGGANFDYLVGAAGDDVYVFDLGDSPLAAAGYTEKVDDPEGANTIQFGAGIQIDNVRVYLYPNGKVLLKYSDTDDVFFEGGLNGAIRTVKFANGVSLSIPSLFGRNSQQVMDVSTTDAGSTLVGSALSNSLLGTGGSSTFQGGWGDDTITGAGGGNVYVYESGDGVDHLYDLASSPQYDGSTEANRLQFGAGIRREDVALKPGGNGTLEVRIAGESAGKVVIHNFDLNDAALTGAVGFFDFADGTSLSYAEFLGAGFHLTGTLGDDRLVAGNLNDRLAGDAGNDTLEGAAGNDTLSGGTGDDVLIGGAGDDLYEYARGQGSDTLVETADGGVNTLRFKYGLNPGDIELGADANHSGYR